MVGVAVKLTDVPEQIVVVDELTDTLAAKFGLTVMVILFELAGEPVAQVAFEVITALTTSLFAKLLLVYVLLLVPTLLPFNFHW